MLDDSGRLWMGRIKVNGRAISYMELRTGNIHNFDTGLGSPRFLKAREVVCWRMRHVTYGMESGFIADVSKKSALYLREFTNRPKTELQRLQSVFSTKEGWAASRLEGAPRGAVDLVIEDTLATGFGCCPRTMFTVVIATSLNGKKSQTSERWSGGRNYSSVTRRLFGECLQLARITLTDSVSARDGLARLGMEN